MNNLSWDPTGGKIDVKEREEIIDDGKTVICVDGHFYTVDSRVLVFNDKDCAERYANENILSQSHDAVELTIESLYDYSFDSDELNLTHVNKYEKDFAFFN